MAHGSCGSLNARGCLQRYAGCVLPSPGLANVLSGPHPYSVAESALLGLKGASSKPSLAHDSFWPRADSRLILVEGSNRCMAVIQSLEMWDSNGPRLCENANFHHLKRCIAKSDLSDCVATHDCDPCKEQVPPASTAHLSFHTASVVCCLWPAPASWPAPIGMTVNDGQCP